MELGDLYISAEALECEEVYNAAQAYRTAPIEAQENVKGLYANLMRTFAMRFEKILREKLAKAPEVFNDGIGEWSDERFDKTTHRARLVCVGKIEK